MTPRSTEEFSRLRNESRKKIIAAALELFAKKGYGETTIESIARSAGVAKGLIYNYFKNKEELLVEAFASGLENIESAFSFLHSVKDPVEVVGLFIDGIFDLFIHAIDMWRLQAGILLNPELPPNIREGILEKMHEYTMFIKHVFEGCGVADAESEAWVFAASIDGVLFYYLLWGERLPLEGCRELLKKKYCHLVEYSIKSDDSDTI